MNTLGAPTFANAANQPPELVGYNAWTLDRVLIDCAKRAPIVNAKTLSPRRFRAPDSRVCFDSSRSLLT